MPQSAVILDDLTLHVGHWQWVSRLVLEVPVASVTAAIEAPGGGAHAAQLGTGGGLITPVRRLMCKDVQKHVQICAEIRKYGPANDGGSSVVEAKKKETKQ